MILNTGLVFSHFKFFMLPRLWTLSKFEILVCTTYSHSFEFPKRVQTRYEDRDWLIIFHKSHGEVTFIILYFIQSVKDSWNTYHQSTKLVQNTFIPTICLHDHRQRAFSILRVAHTHSIFTSKWDHCALVMYFPQKTVWMLKILLNWLLKMGVINMAMFCLILQSINIPWITSGCA